MLVLQLRGGDGLMAKTARKTISIYIGEEILQVVDQAAVRAALNRHAQQVVAP